MSTVPGLPKRYHDASEEPGIQKQREAEEAKRTDREQRNFANLEEILARAAAATGLTFDDIMVQTPSRLRGMIYAAHVQAGMEMSKTSARAHAEYLATLDAIAKRLRAEKAVSSHGGIVADIPSVT